MAVANELITTTATKPIPNYNSFKTSNLMYYVPIQKEKKKRRRQAAKKRESAE